MDIKINFNNKNGEKYWEKTPIDKFKNLKF